MGEHLKRHFQKACRSLEVKRFGFGQDGFGHNLNDVADDQIEKLLSIPTPERLFALPVAINRGFSVEKMHELSKIDPWFLNQLVDLIHESKSFLLMMHQFVVRRNWGIRMFSWRIF